MKSGNIKKIAVVAVIVAIAASFFVFDLGQYLTLSYLKASREKLQVLYAEHTALVIGGYFLFYIAVVALNLPGATIMTLAGGALFGFWIGLATVSFASTIGATLACLVSRYLIGEWVQKRFGERLNKVNQGIEREGAFYLFTMRLIPAIPFFAINLMMGLTRMPLRRYYWVSQIGMLPGTMVYVNAGKELGRIDSLSGILSPGLIVSFVILGIFPIVVKRLLWWYRVRTGRINAAGQDAPPGREE